VSTPPDRQVVRGVTGSVLAKGDHWFRTEEDCYWHAKLTEKTMNYDIVDCHVCVLAIEKRIC